VAEKVLLVNADDPDEVRVALVEDGRLEEVYFETGPDPSGKGNVYAARVQNVERGMGAAFLDLGGGRSGFLHVSDLVLPEAPEPAPVPAPPGTVEVGDLAPEPVDGSGGGEASAGATTADAPRVAPDAAASPAGSPEGAAPGTSGVAPGAPGLGEGRRIQDLLRPGQDLLVQVSRGPVGQKGPALTTRISLPGRYVVLLANSTRSGVSRRFDGDARDRARSLAKDLVVPEGMGTILRTASESRSREELQADVDALVALWESLRRRLASGSGPRLVHAETDLALRAARDLLPPDAKRIVVDREDVAARVRDYLASTSVAGGPPPVPVEVHAGPVPLFHAHGVEDQLEEAFRRTVRLPSGGSIVLDPTEALVAIDVNSGRLTGEEDAETTALRTDLEAAAAVARQLRLRDLGGVIVVDFIDLRDAEHVRQVEQAFRDALARDRARLRVGRIGPFGCLEMTRQRLRPSLSSLTHAPCPACGGTGRRRLATGIARRVLREALARAARARNRGGLDVRVAPAVYEVLRSRAADRLRALEDALTGPLRLRPDPSLPPGGFAIKGLPEGRKPLEDAPDRRPPEASSPSPAGARGGEGGGA
jgi:ribonuclease E